MKVTKHNVTKTLIHYLIVHDFCFSFSPSLLLSLLLKKTKKLLAFYTLTIDLHASGMQAALAKTEPVHKDSGYR